MTMQRSFRQRQIHLRIFECTWPRKPRHTSRPRRRRRMPICLDTNFKGKVSAMKVSTILAIVLFASTINSAEGSAARRHLAAATPPWGSHVNGSHRPDSPASLMPEFESMAAQPSDDLTTVGASPSRQLLHGCHGKKRACGSCHMIAPHDVSCHVPSLTEVPWYQNSPWPAHASVPL